MTHGASLLLSMDKMRDGREREHDNPSINLFATVRKVHIILEIQGCWTIFLLYLKGIVTIYPSFYNSIKEII